MYISNLRRYSLWKDNPKFKEQKKILASNIKTEGNEKELIFSFNKLIKCGWAHVDNSGLMVLRLLDKIDIKSITIAGFDGYCYAGVNTTNYATQELELANVREDPVMLNNEISNMLKDYMETRERDTPISFLTSSRFTQTTPIPIIKK